MADAVVDIDVTVSLFFRGNIRAGLPTFGDPGSDSGRGDVRS